MRPKTFIAIATVVLCLLAPTAPGQTPSPPTTDNVARLTVELEPKINDEISKGQLPGFAIGVVKNGKLIYAKGFGVTKLGTDFYQPLKLRLQYPNLTFKGTAKIPVGKDSSGKPAERETLVLEAPRNGSPRRFFFDSVTALLLRVEDWNAAGKMIEAVQYGDYREVDGVKVPFAIYHIEDVLFNIKLTEVKQNVPVDDSVFVKPKK